MSWAEPSRAGGAGDPAGVVETRPLLIGLHREPSGVRRPAHEELTVKWWWWPMEVRGVAVI